MKRIISLLIILISGSAICQTEKWEVSSENAAKTNPIDINFKSLSTGKNIAIKSCISCHGSKLDGNGLIKSTNLISEIFQKQSDGIIFTKISEGKNQMPSFKGMFKEEEIWTVINYLRALYNPSLLPPPKDVSLEIMLNEEMKSITAFVFTKSDTSKMPVKDVDIHFYIKRQFGLMNIGDASNLTKDNGKVTVSIPENIIGDDMGNIQIIAKIENSIEYKNTEQKFIKSWGEPLKTDDTWFDKRSLWGSSSKIPIWLLIMIIGITGIVISCLIYVVYIIFKIKKASEIYLN
jgi:mono/diheme cytochrome c family protein